MHPSSTFRCFVNLPATARRVMTPIRGSPRWPAPDRDTRRSRLAPTEPAGADGAGGHGVAGPAFGRAERRASRMRSGQARSRPRFPAASPTSFLPCLMSTPNVDGA